MSWIKGTSSDYIDLSNDIVAAVTATSADSVDSVVSGGTSGYVVGDLITLTGGTFTTATVLEVVTVNGGGQVTAVRIDNAGIYSVAPGDPVSQGSTDGAGVGTPTFNMTYSANGWTADRDTTWDSTDRDVVLHGTGGGSDTIYVGWRTYNVSGSGRYNWELHGYTGYNSGVPNKNQPGVSPGEHDNGVVALQHGSYWTLDNATIDWWMSVTPSRIIVVAEIAGNYYPMYLGFINRYATSTEYPYPLLVAGNSSEHDNTHDQVGLMSTLTDPWATDAIADGPMYLITPAGTWISFANAQYTGSDINPGSARNVTIPCGILDDSNDAPTEDETSFHNLEYSFNKIVNQEDLSAPLANLQPTPGTGEDYYVLFPTMLVHSNTISDQQMYGEIDDVFWFQAFTSVSPGGAPGATDRIIQTDVYRVFPNCNRSGIHGFFALKEG